MTSRVYLAGPIHAVSDDGREWREMIQPWGVGIEWVDPLDEHNHETDDTLADDEVMELDRELIDSCDGMLVRYELVPSWGTPREMEYVSSHGSGSDIPVVVWTEVDEEDRSPWVCDAVAIESHPLGAVQQLMDLV